MWIYGYAPSRTQVQKANEAKAMARERERRSVQWVIDGDTEAAAKYHDRLHGIDKRFDAVMCRKT